MPKTIREQISEIVSSKEIGGYSTEYLKSIQSNMQNTESQFRSSMLLMFLLLVAFELLSKAAIPQITVGPFQFRDLSLIQKLLPIVIAYNYLELGSLITMRRLMREAFESFIKHVYKPIYDRNLEYYLLPSSIFVTADILATELSPIKRFSKYLHLPLVTTVIFLPLLFEAYAIYINFSTFGSSDIVVWLASLMSFLLLVQGVAYFFSIESFIGKS